MARTTKIIEAPRLLDLVTTQGTTKGLISLVNDYLATLVNPNVRAWSLDARIVEKRMNIQWMFMVVTDDGGAALANPFTLQVNQATDTATLDATLTALYAAFPAEFFSGIRLTKLDSDVQNYAKQYVAAGLRNLVLAEGTTNYNLLA
jgi:hypothetical protein